MTDDELRDKEDILSVDHITAKEFRRLHPQSKPLPENKEEAECHNCGYDYGEDWDERKMPSGPNLGNTWKYKCLNCGFETFEVGT